MNNLLKVGFIGAGAIHFGGSEGPWDHARRIEKIGGVEIIGIADPDIEKAISVLEGKKASESVSHLYKNCKVYSTLQEFLKDKANKPDVIFMGTPPAFRGSLETGKDLELQVVQAGIHLFVEKPVSCLLPESFSSYVSTLEEARKENGVIVSVGYMMRYHHAVQKMKELIKSHGGRVMSINARYYCAYSEMDHAFWWDVSKSGGPIIEQATHFCDLARFLAGDIQEESVAGTQLKATNPAGKLSKLTEPVAKVETTLEERNMVPRVTASFWHFQDGGIGSLMHTVALHGNDYESSLDLQMDGLRLTLTDPYFSSCTLSVRGSQDTEDQIYTFKDADMYETEIKTFFEAVRAKDQSKILSSYPDAGKTYSMTWAIRRASEK